jgi:hypothetical protein
MLPRLALISFFASGIAGTLCASPVAVNLADFLNPTLITFDSIGNGVEITNQFAGLGVTFSGGLFGDTSAADLARFPPAGAAGAAVAVNSNGVCGIDLNPACNTITLAFAFPVLRIGMHVVTNNDDDFRITVPGGSLDFSTDLDPVNTLNDFVGLQDLAGFTTVTLQAFGTKSHAFNINDLVFEPVPEPANWAVILVAFAAIALVHRRRSMAKA